MDFSWVNVFIIFLIRYAILFYSDCLEVGHVFLFEGETLYIKVFLSKYTQQFKYQERILASYAFPDLKSHKYHSLHPVSQNYSWYKRMRLANLFTLMKIALSIEVLEVRGQTVTIRPILRTHHSTLSPLHA